MIDCNVCKNKLGKFCMATLGKNIDTKEEIAMLAPIKIKNCGVFDKITENICSICKNMDVKGNCSKTFHYLNTIYYKSKVNEKECEKFERK